jgi:hypothetical protein
MSEDERNAVFDECFEYNDHLRANGHLVEGGHEEKDNRDHGRYYVGAGKSASVSFS